MALGLLGDNQGTIRDIVDRNGDEVQHYKYDAFGRLLAGSTNLTRYLYTAREFDSKTGMQYNRERWYDSSTGRFLSEDPLGFAGGDYNLYRYAGNAPTNATDPQGTWGEPNGARYTNLGDSAPSRHSILTKTLPPASPIGMPEYPWFANVKITGIQPRYTPEEATLNYWREGYDAIGWGVVLLPGGPGEAGLFAAGGFAGTILRPGPTPINQARAVRGWRVGEPINNLTALGDVPAWNTVRERYWKNEAFFHEAGYSPTNLGRMRQGLAPQTINDLTGQLESMELHHNPPQWQGGLFRVQPLWPDEHSLIDPYR